VKPVGNGHLVVSVNEARVSVESVRAQLVINRIFRVCFRTTPDVQEEFSTLGTGTITRSGRIQSYFGVGLLSSDDAALCELVIESEFTSIIPGREVEIKVVHEALYFPEQ
jgi:hypothetical protein